MSLDMTNKEIRAAILTLLQPMMTHANKDVGPRMNSLESTMVSILRDFVTMNLSIFLGSRMREDTQ